MGPVLGTSLWKQVPAAPPNPILLHLSLIQCEGLHLLLPTLLAPKPQVKCYKISSVDSFQWWEDVPNAARSRAIDETIASIFYICNFSSFLVLDSLKERTRFYSSLLMSSDNITYIWKIIVEWAPFDHIILTKSNYPKLSITTYSLCLISNHLRRHIDSYITQNIKLIIFVL